MAGENVEDVHALVVTCELIGLVKEEEISERPYAPADSSE